MTITPRFVSLPAMLLAGVRRHHAVADAPRDIPRQWEAFEALPFAHAPSVRYGVTCAFDGAAQRMEYLCAVEVTTFDGLPEGTGRMRVPAAHYAVFDLDGSSAGIPLLWQQVMHWEATNPAWQDGHTPNFERYEQGVVSIWMPVVPRAET